jgi:hypothetical protein
VINGKSEPMLVYKDDVEVADKKAAQE